MKNVDGIDNELPELDEFIGLVRKAFSIMGINPSDKSVFYKREDHRYSQLGIQVGRGDSDDLASYVIYEREVNGIPELFSNTTISIAHIDGRIYYYGQMLTNVLSSEDIANFFNSVEKRFEKETLDLK